MCKIMDLFITRKTSLLFGISWLLQLLYIIGVDSLHVLEPEKTIYNQMLFHKQASLYTLVNLEQNTTYEIRVSYPAVVPTDFMIRVIEPKLGGHFKSRNLLNIEKAIFTTGLSTQGYEAEVIAHRIGFPKDPKRLTDPVAYNIVVEKLYAGLSVNSWKMVCYAILIFIMTFKYLVPLAHQYIKSVFERDEHKS
eukprot:Seg717.1 transcript_id=Seg717.1/GoldUCD/mRNA.D3Y31 product="hypothetical protein" protein_id=Seg717.1/GoldUCD/D3Y31